MLTSLTWRFSANGQTTTERMRLLPGGRIAGYRHPNEYYWSLEDGAGRPRMVLMDKARNVTSRLSLISKDGEGLRFSGPYVGDATLTFDLVSHEPGPWPEFGAATRQVLADQIAEHGWNVGAHSYGAPSIVEGGLAQFSLGRFCSIATGVTITLGDHKIGNVTSYPFRGLRPFWPSTPHDAIDHTTRGDVRIGNDVWIGTNAFVGSGVTVGDGAVIGAAAVVTRDVPPYAIVLGAPARVVRHRFEADIIEALLGIRWWDWPEERIDAVMPLLLSDRVEALVRVAEAQPETLEALVLLVDDALDAEPAPAAVEKARVRGAFDRLRGRLG